MPTYPPCPDLPDVPNTYAIDRILTQMRHDLRTFQSFPASLLPDFFDAVLGALLDEWTIPQRARLRAHLEQRFPDSFTRGGPQPAASSPHDPLSSACASGLPPDENALIQQLDRACGLWHAALPDLRAAVLFAKLQITAARYLTLATFDLAPTELDLLAHEAYGPHSLADFSPDPANVLPFEDSLLDQFEKTCSAKLNDLSPLDACQLFVALAMTTLRYISRASELLDPPQLPPTPDTLPLDSPPLPDLTDDITA